MCFFRKLNISRNNYCFKTSTQTCHKNTFNTTILARHVIKFFDLNFLFKRREHFCPKLYNTANQNNNVLIVILKCQFDVVRMISLFSYLKLKNWNVSSKPNQIPYLCCINPQVLKKQQLNLINLKQYICNIVAQIKV